MGDPWGGTLLVLPPVVASLWWLGRWVRCRGGQVLRSPTATAQAGVLALLILIILARRHLGLAPAGAAVDRVLAGGLALIVAHHVVALVRALARSYDARVRPRPPWPFFVLPLTVYVAVLPWVGSQREPDGDEPYFLLITHSLAYDLDTELTNNYDEQHSLGFMSRPLEPEWADPVRPDGRLYSRHSLVLPLALVPAYRLMGRSGAAGTIAVLSAWMAWWCLALAARRWPTRPRELVGAWSLLALTPPLLVYALQIWVEVPAALLTLVALGHIDELRRSHSLSQRRWIWFAVAVVLLPLLKLRFAVLSASLLALAWWRGGRSRRAVVLLGVAFMVITTGVLLFNQIAFGRPLRDHSLQVLYQIQARSAGDYLQGATGLFWDCAFGLFASNPAWLLLVPAVLLIAWRRHPLMVDLLICGLPYLALVAPRREWYGAWAPPFRFGMVLLPLLALTLVPLLQRRRWAGPRAVIVALCAVALPAALLWVVVPSWTYDLAAGTNHWIDHLSARWAADVGRFLPSMVRMRPASWIVPPLVTAAIVVLWWLPMRRPRQAGLGVLAALLLSVAALPLAAQRLPTRWAEFEDHQVAKRGGDLYPEPWVPYRPRFRGGWTLAAGDSVSVPVASGGPRVSIEIDLHAQARGEEASTVELAAGGRQLGSWRLSEVRGWQTLSLEDLRWPAGEPLSVQVRAGAAATASSRVILDRVRFVWR